PRVADDLELDPVRREGLARLLGAAPRVISVASTDSGGGAGTLADAKAIVRAGGFPLCAVVGLTAQSTVGVDAVRTLDPDFIHAQITTTVRDLGLDGVKTGMLATPALVEVAAAALEAAIDPAHQVPIVVDPVLRAESGAPLMEEGGEAAYGRNLLHMATVTTPNLFEARALAGRPDEDDPAVLARAIHERHGCAAIVTGGHGREAGDTLCDGDGLTVIPGVRLPRSSTHGAGCTHSATLATLLARGVPLREAAARAKAAATAAVAHGRPFGAGAGPVDVLGDLATARTGVGA
ncbi:MAG: hydroxymethylpyrimidine/phosphomethylpyrimidine kinase, partial [Miltoncostaeaceae bacterium]